MSREVVQEEVYHLLRCLLNYRIQVSSVKHPCFYTLRLLHITTLVDNYAINTSTTCISTLSFDFEQPLILEHAIIRLEVLFLTNIPMGYSYWCSHLNWTFHGRPVTKPVHYGVTLANKVVQYPTCVLDILRCTHHTWQLWYVLHYFRSLF